MVRLGVAAALPHRQPGEREGLATWVAMNLRARGAMLDDEDRRLVLGLAGEVGEVEVGARVLGEPRE